jgi:DinB superfamily
MTKPGLNEIAEYFKRYISRVEETNLFDALITQLEDFTTFLKLIPANRENYAYAPGKWTIKDVLQHITDTERIFAYRALCFARKDPVHQPGFDQDDYGSHAHANNRAMSDLIEEFIIVRRCTIALFRSFDNEQLYWKGMASDKEANPLIMGFAIAGHCRYHQEIISARYL